MEIHSPERPIHSVKDFLLALTTITIGILIAMSLEGIVTWSHHRTLVREAKARLAEEIADNTREVSEFLNELPAVMKSQGETIRFIDDRLARKPMPSGPVELKTTFRVMSLSSTNWTTAQTTGALGYMDYADVQKYANAYDLQAKVAQLQDRMLEGFIGSVKPADPDKATEGELRAWKRDTAAATSYLDGLRQLADGLLKDYANARAPR